MKILNEKELKTVNGGGGGFNFGGDIREIGQMANNAWKDLKDGWNRG